MRLKLSATAAALGAALLCTAVLADGGQVQFSADMVRHGPGGQTATGKMYMGDGRTRMEMSQQGREVVRISDRNRRVEWILFPADKGYLERIAPPAAAGTPEPKAPSAEDNPCAGMPALTCRRVGVEDVNGRPAVKWEMSMTHQGQTLTGAQWLDQARGLPIKHQMPNGQSMELKLLGIETVDGRKVEKWQMTTTVAGQQPTATLQWYDPELKLAIRDEAPGGFTSELKNIKVGPQPDSLFQVPDGYAKMSAPPGGGPQQPQPAQ